MRVSKILVAFAEIAMRVDLQDAELAVSFRDGLIITKRGAVIAAQQAYEFSLAEEGFGLFVHPFIKVGAALVYLLQGFAHEAVLLYDLVFGGEVDIQFGFLAQVVAL